MAEDHTEASKDWLLRYGSDEMYNIRKAYNMENKQNRENAIAIIDEWIKCQDHFMKKDYSKEYIERCLITSHGSLDRTKKQIDAMCTFRTLLPQFFDISSFRDANVASFFSTKGYGAVSPNLTKQLHRVVTFKTKPNVSLDSAEISLLFKCIIYCSEYGKCNEFCLGFQVIFDIIDCNANNILPHVNLVEIQQMIPILTKGYGAKIKGIYFVTNSKIIKSFINVLKPVLSEKIGNRLHAVSDRKLMTKFIDIDVLPEDYGGKEASVAILHEKLVQRVSEEQVEELIKEMKKGTVDESKRRIDIFNDEYMGAPGTFRTLCLD